MLTGVSRATATRAKAAPETGRVDPPPRTAVVANRLSPSERTRVLAVLNSEEFIDQPPLQVYATPLAHAQYLCSVSTMHRILAEHHP